MDRVVHGRLAMNKLLMTLLLVTVPATALADDYVTKDPALTAAGVGFVTVGAYGIGGGIALFALAPPAAVDACRTSTAPVCLNVGPISREMAFVTGTAVMVLGVAAAISGVVLIIRGAGRVARSHTVAIGPDGLGLRF